MKDEMIKSGDTERVPEAAGDGRAEGMAENSAAARAAAAKAAVTACARLDGNTKNAVLAAVSNALSSRRAEIFKANAADMADAKELPAATQKRLRFDESKLAVCLDGIAQLIALPDPNGRVLMQTLLDDGLLLKKVSCPIGVIGVIFEARPDALVQISTLCIKSGNCCLLKGGSETANTNAKLFEIILTAAMEAGLPEGSLGLLQSRQDVRDMLGLNGYIDLIIPRGSNAFVQYIMNNTSIPVLGHADGICHVYVDKDADIAEAVRIVTDSKAQYVSVCNAAETLLVHRDIAAEALPKIAKSLNDAGVTIVGCRETCGIIAVQPASEEDWKTEYLDYKISVKIVGSAREAVEHINRYGSGHTDAIVTKNAQTAEYFMDAVDSANVYWNCSTRFADGYRYGFGAEVGISTNKIHARGPVGLDGLMIYKYKLYGSGQTAGEYADGKKHFKHIQLPCK